MILSKAGGKLNTPAQIRLGLLIEPLELSFSYFQVLGLFSLTFTA
jgi:hypothetical protein